MQRHVMAIAGVELELFEVGEGPPILYLHNGGGFDPEHEFVRLLSTRHRLIAPSHPGFGQSTLPDWIDAPEPGGVNCTTRKPLSKGKSASSRHPRPS